MLRLLKYIPVILSIVGVIRKNRGNTRTIHTKRNPRR